MGLELPMPFGTHPIPPGRPISWPCHRPNPGPRRAPLLPLRPRRRRWATGSGRPKVEDCQGTWGNMGMTMYGPGTVWHSMAMYGSRLWYQWPTEPQNWLFLDMSSIWPSILGVILSHSHMRNRTFRNQQKLQWTCGENMVKTWWDMIEQNLHKILRSTRRIKMRGNSVRLSGPSRTLANVTESIVGSDASDIK